MNATMQVVRRAMLVLALVVGFGVGAFSAAGPAQAASLRAYQVSVARTGGFVGVHEQYTVSLATSHALVPSLLRAASGRRFQSLSESYLATQSGADRFAYTVTVSYVDGTDKVVSTVDGVDAPPVLWQVIDLTIRIDRDLAAAMRS